MDYNINDDVSIILWQPFLNTTNVVWNMRKKMITMSIEDEYGVKKIVFVEGQEIHPNGKDIVFFNL
ncbi:hypothetical protein Syun_019055 [Stephania yunnanensis]|uniref:Uncharacterized protein n=1 Tax=Stephania yunnanensis TaxID=152371 RepID=A0AAP0ITD8_9MAGN